MLFAHIVVFSQTPYNVVMNFTQDPKTQMAFNWFTNANNLCGQVTIIGGGITKTVTATCSQYAGSTIHKAIVTGLTPNTTYSFQIGSVNGTFKTAPIASAPFSFVYITDTQVQYDVMNYPSIVDFSTLRTNFNVVRAHYPNVSFWLHCGDFKWNGQDVVSDMSQWKRFFASASQSNQPNLFVQKPLVPVLGNHDDLSYVPQGKHFEKHFNVSSASFDFDGSTYTFTYGDAQFFVINSENCSGEKCKNSTYINNLKTWMKTTINDSTITWHIVCYHIPTYTSKINGVYYDPIANIFDELNIDIAFQGHTHIYDVIGPVKNKKLIQGTVASVVDVPKHNNENVSGKLGGIFNVQNGTLYFTNGTFGDEWMSPYLKNYSPNFALVTGRSGSYYNDTNGTYVNRPTYSNVSVASDKIIITTYEIVNGNSQVFDEITVVKRPCLPSSENPVSQTINGSVLWNTTQSISNNIVIPSGKTLTIKANVSTKDCSVIIVKSGGKFIIDGGTLDSISVCAESGSTCTIQNNGKVLLGEFNDVDIHLGATFDVLEGEILYK
jgi:hypothetical protein